MHTPAVLFTWSPARRRMLLTAAPAVLGLVLLSGCGGGSGKAQAATAPSASSTGAPGGQGNRQFPGASGEIAARTGATLQVQNSTSQTAVTYSSSTRITDTVPATAADVQVGMCAVARPAVTSSSSATTSAGTVAAATVVLSQAVNGSCTGGFGGRFGNRNGSGNGSAAPRPSGAPSPGARGFDRAAFGANGLITSVHGSSFVVESRRRAAGASPAPTSSPTLTDITVTTTTSTAFSKTISATSTALALGDCVTAIGKTDDTGAVTASSIAIEPKVDGSCSSGFGRRPGGFGGTAGSGGATGGSGG